MPLPAEERVVKTSLLYFSIFFLTVCRSVLSTFCCWIAILSKLYYCNY